MVEPRQSNPRAQPTLEKFGTYFRDPSGIDYAYQW